MVGQHVLIYRMPLQAVLSMKLGPVVSRSARRAELLHSKPLDLARPDQDLLLIEA
jgi:hypothetical protein